jgi:enoyl-CoA hydratase
MSTVLYEQVDSVAVVTLNRPDKLNAFNAEMLEDLMSALARAGADASVRVVVLKGAGRAFSSGYDVTPGEHSPQEKGIVQDREDLQGMIDKWIQVYEFPKPIIAQVHGFCIAGATMLAICCDITLVAEDCRIRWPSLPLGGGLISTMWTWLVGPKKAREMSYIAGSEMTGTEAHFWGWANRAVPAAELEAATMTMARAIARTPSDLLRLKKLAINRIMDIQGFRTAAMFGAEWDAIAHFGPGATRTTEKIKEVGVKGAIAWLGEQG